MTLLLGMLIFPHCEALAQSASLPDTFNPTVVPGPLLTVNYQITNNPSPTITGTINNPDASVFILIDKKTYRGVNSGDGSWAVGISDHLDDGSYDVTVIATPPSGNKVIMMVSKSITIDTVPPRITIQDTSTGDLSPKLSGTVDDNMALILVSVDGVIYPANNNGDGTWTLPQGTISPNLSPGTHSISANAIDLAGNVNNVDAKGTLTITSANSPDNNAV